MEKYVVKPGFRHGAKKEHGPGDVVELDPADAAGFVDKLEPYDPDSQNVADLEPASEPEPDEDSPDLVEPADVDAIEDMIADMSIPEVLESVDEGRFTAKQALEAERDGKERITLIRELEGMI